MRDHGSSTTLEVATQEHVCFAFKTLLAQLKRRALPEPDFPEATTALFVTWKTSPRTRSDHARLRGCIGILEPRTLHKALRDYTLNSALHDRRFSPIQLSEVSLLSCFETASSWQDWVVGQHGLIIEFIDPDLNCRRSATFLPEVAAEQGWTQEETIDALISKAGYAGGAALAVRESLAVTRYQSTTCTLTYAEFLELQGEAADSILEPKNGVLASCASALA